MGMKKNNPGCGCCGPCCQAGWDALLARFTSAEISGTNISTQSKTLQTTFATESCGDSDYANECYNGAGASSDRFISGGTCGGWWWGTARRFQSVNSSGCDAIFMEVSWSISVSCVNGVPRYSASYIVDERAASSGKDCFVSGCPTGDYYLANPVSAGLVYPGEANGLGNFQSLSSSSASSLSVGDDITSSFVRMIFQDSGTCGARSQIYPVSSPSATDYNKLTEYYYGASRSVLTEDVNDLPTSFTLTPAVNPASISATFSFT